LFAGGVDSKNEKVAGRHSTLSSSTETLKDEAWHNEQIIRIRVLDLFAWGADSRNEKVARRHSTEISLTETSSTEASSTETVMDKAWQRERNVWMGVLDVFAGVVDSGNEKAGRRHSTWSWEPWCVCSSTEESSCDSDVSLRKSLQFRRRRWCRKMGKRWGTDTGCFLYTREGKSLCSLSHRSGSRIHK